MELWSELFWVLWIPLTVSSLFGLPYTEASDSPVLFCYYSSHSQNRQGIGKFLPENIDTSLCTHVIYAFADIVNGRYLKANGWNDLGDDGLYKRTIKLKRKNSNLKVLLAVGGWAAGSKPFVTLIESEKSRRIFAENAIRFLRTHGFDGLDLDWEFPGTRGSSADDKFKFTLLLKELQQKFKEEALRTGKEKLLLTLAAAGGSYFINAAYESSKIGRFVDYLLIMAYNFHGSWNSFTGHHSGLFPRSEETGGEREWNQAWAIDYWLNKAGVPKSKLVVGIPTYGMSFTLEDASENGLKAKANGGGEKGKYTGESGILSYYEICDNLDSGWTERWIDEQKAPYAYRGDQWVGYENEHSVKLKAKYINYLGLAGAFIWSVEMDDFTGSCGSGRYPLLSAIARTLRDRGQTPRQSRARGRKYTSAQNEYRAVPPSTINQYTEEREIYRQPKSTQYSQGAYNYKDDYLPIRMENMNGPSAHGDEKSDFENPPVKKNRHSLSATAHDGSPRDDYYNYDHISSTSGSRKRYSAAELAYLDALRLDPTIRRQRNRKTAKSTSQLRSRPSEDTQTNRWKDSEAYTAVNTYRNYDEDDAIFYDFGSSNNKYFQLENDPSIGFTHFSRYNDRRRNRKLSDFEKSAPLDDVSNTGKDVLHPLATSSPYAYDSFLDSQYYDDVIEKQDRLVKDYRDMKQGGDNDIENYSTIRHLSRDGSVDDLDLTKRRPPTSQRHKTNSNSKGYPCEENGMFADPESCTNYFVCVQHGGRWYNFRMKCPSNLAYLPSKAACRYRPECNDT